MKIGNLGLLYGKEILDLFRDRRTIFTMMVMPMLMMPLSIVSTNLVMTRSRKDAEASHFRLAVSAPEQAAPVLERLRASGFIVVPSADPKAEAESQKAVAGLVLVPGGEAMTATVYSDQSEAIRWQVLRGRINEVLNKLRDEKLEAALRQAGLPVAIANPYRIESVNLAKPRKMAGTFLGGLLSFMLIIFLLNGAMYGAVDMTAGEKERKTIEILLSSAAARVEIVVAKVLTAATISLITAGLSVTSLLLSFTFMRSHDADAAGIFSLPADPATLGLILLSMAPMTIFVAAMAVALATPARSAREGMSYLTPIFFVVMLLCGAAFLPGLENSKLLPLIPVANFTQALKSVFRGEWSWLAFGTSLLVNALAAAVAVAFAVRRFHDERMLLRV